MLAESLPQFNRRARERTLGNGFEMGIGLNSGLFIVRQRRLGASARVHGLRGYREHGVAHGGNDEDR